MIMIWWYNDLYNSASGRLELAGIIVYIAKLRNILESGHSADDTPSSSAGSEKHENKNKNTTTLSGGAAGSLHTNNTIRWYVL